MLYHNFLFREKNFRHAHTFVKGERERGLHLNLSTAHPRSQSASALIHRKKASEHIRGPFINT